MPVSRLCLKDAVLSFAAVAAVAVVIMDKKIIPKTIPTICLYTTKTFDEFSHDLTKETVRLRAHIPFSYTLTFRSCLFIINICRNMKIDEKKIFPSESVLSKDAGREKER